MKIVIGWLDTDQNQPFMFPSIRQCSSLGPRLESLWDCKDPTCMTGSFAYVMNAEMEGRSFQSLYRIGNDSKCSRQYDGDMSKRSTALSTFELV